MKKILIILIGLLAVFGCSHKKTGAVNNAMNIVEERFSKSLLRDSLPESSITYLWAEYDSKYNCILSFQYGGIAIEYFYNSNEYGEQRDTFIRRGEVLYIDELKSSYKKMAGGYSSYDLDQKQFQLMDGFKDYFIKQYPKEEDWIEHMISDLAKNNF